MDWLDGFTLIHSDPASTDQTDGYPEYQHEQTQTADVAILMEVPPRGCLSLLVSVGCEGGRQGWSSVSLTEGAEFHQWCAELTDLTDQGRTAEDSSTKNI